MKRILPQILVGLLLLNAISCSTKERHSMTVDVQNNTGATIAEAQVWAVGSVTSKPLVEGTNIPAGGLLRGKLKRNLGLKSDGTYELRLTESSGKRTIRAGYFTNGYSLDERISFQVEQDTVIVNRVAGKIGLGY